MLYTTTTTTRNGTKESKEHQLTNWSKSNNKEQIKKQEPFWLTMPGTLRNNLHEKKSISTEIQSSLQ